MSTKGKEKVTFIDSKEDVKDSNLIPPYDEMNTNWPHCDRMKGKEAHY